ncbi:MAG TPA: type II toxin-antitoxin system HicB family antitoxin [Longimicrobiaceae bacterium]|jgi:predicted RNase H-like HicB family nuclease|nr:type II toxin-antitoxin system HicB family antitoxin [Longimicrobiaceae bacterium]
MAEARTRFSVGLEQGPDGAMLAHGLDLPGCAAFGDTAEDAVAAFEHTLHEWLRFLASAGEPVPGAGAELEIAVDEWISTDADVAGGETTACFAADLAALSAEEIDRGLRLLGDLRGRVLARVRRQPAAILDAESEGGWTARGILEELARAGWWTLSRLGASPMAEVPESTLGRLDTSLALAVQVFTAMPPEMRGNRLELEGEEWTPRKVMRRLLWLEWTLGRAAASALEPVTGQGG